MLWVKAFHIIFMVSWFAGLFYLPRLFVNHAMTQDPAVAAQLLVMERKLYRFITPLGVLTLATGLWLWLGYGITGGWLMLKGGLVGILIAYHLYCGKLHADFKQSRNTHSHVWYRWFNELPVLILFAVVILVVVKPF